MTVKHLTNDIGALESFEGLLCLVSLYMCTSTDKVCETSWGTLQSQALLGTT